MWCKKKEIPKPMELEEWPPKLELISAKELAKQSWRHLSRKLHLLQCDIVESIDRAANDGLFSYIYHHRIYGGEQEENAIRDFLKGKLMAEYGYRVSITKQVITQSESNRLEIIISWGKEDEQ